ncbi:tRNA (adenosine(37)-N6)-threonylcarbamoyltransferase complex dimerization subunit type 1 TsaB [Paenibacillus albus]|uniref:tRNA (Adenosine(37)-N6)-threonylcarbamoyltransferase complex dimerization subunit type 1 TsaB n=1 Tax=Paenibacillus albus TaxID=2495582 RepID=A0A3Q8X9Q6_9BACL|nr:tRNA (adenosine(37)-N6)-threonylcarbamoyltransferase complex dimerization subunit type 1 TsaB [Paenibacillus albus]AZN43403.1 tRNA (adenosine(37)-N6)-threonylcarbamoyltransferase complex dimerization subunit type 1 TsaB [Paenibacillus albus]
MSEHTGQQLVLALDTSTASLACALVRGQEVLQDIQSLAERNHSVHTVSIVQQILADNGVKPEELDGIAIGRGPGSYTGMRIAVSVGKTLSWVWNKPLVGVSSIEALGFGAWQSHAAVEQSHSQSQTGAPVWIVPIMDARRGQVYTALFEAASDGDGTWTRLARDGIRLMHDWVDKLVAKLAEIVASSSESESLPSAIWIVGDLELHEVQADRLRELCAEAGIAVEVRKQPYILEGRSVASLGLKRLAAGEQDDAHTFIPNYTQLTEAEVKLQEKTAQQAAEGKGGVSQ